MLDNLVFDKDEDEASQSALPERDRALKEMRANYKEYRSRWKR